MVTDPGFFAFANPFVPLALLTPTTDGLDELHVTARVVMSYVEPSLYVPTAISCRVLSFGMLGFAGVIAIDTSVTFVTVKSVAPEVPPRVAVIVVVPTARGVASPSVEILLLMVATLVSLELHVTVVVKS
jgi:hypothetical protein